MQKEEEKKPRKSKAGRKPKADPAIHKHYCYLNEQDNIRLETLFMLSDFKYISQFIRDCVLNKPINRIEIDKSAIDFTIKLSLFRGQFRGIANNYNQLIRTFKEQFGEKKAFAFLYRLEQVTIELAIENREIEQQIQKMENALQTKFTLSKVAVEKKRLERI